jgi:SAM-dependent methyltransferase
VLHKGNVDDSATIAAMDASTNFHGAMMAPSDWLLHYVYLLPVGSHVLDVACGAGRHVRWLAERGYDVTGIDQDADALATLSAALSLLTRTVSLPKVRTIVTDIEARAWPLADEQFDAVLVTHYLHRPIWENLLAAVTPGGLLIYETFAVGNEVFGKPSRPDFLLRPGELLQVVRNGFTVIAYEDRQIETPKRAMIQRIVARKHTA